MFFLMTLQIETAVIYNSNGYFDSNSDNKFFIICVIYLVVYHILFFLYAVYVRREEQHKLIMDSDEVEKEVNYSRPALTFDYRRAKRMGRNSRLLSFKAMTKQEEDEHVQKWKAFQEQELQNKLVVVK